MICDFCDKSATYRQGHLNICSGCFGYFTDMMFKNWHQWYRNGKIGQEPPLWVYHHDNKIQK